MKNVHTSSLRLFVLCIIFLPQQAISQSVQSLDPPAGFTYNRFLDPVIVRHDDPAYTLVDEAALAAGLARPFLEGPASLGSLWQTARIVQDADPVGGTAVLKQLSLLFPAPHVQVETKATFSLAGGLEGLPEPNLVMAPMQFLYSDVIVTGDAELPEFNGTPSRTYLDHLRLTDLLNRDPFLDLRFLFRTGVLALDLNPELRPASNVYRSADGTWSNAAVFTQPDRIDVNVPYRGMASVLLDSFEFRLGRDKLQLGPGRRSSLGIGYNLPWADYASARANFGNFAVSWYMLRLNPVITQEEENYLLALREFPELQLEDNASYQLQGIERAKHLIASRLTWRPAAALAFALTQHHLVGGRQLQLSDANPLLVFHNLFQEGLYSVPVTLEFSAVPARGLELYGQYMLYDATVADEVGSGTENAGASAWQLGLTALSTPWFNAGSGRFRLDLELAKADPWIYGKYISWRQFSSRYILVEPSAGRFWADYPIGFHLGPDAWEFWSKLSYGSPPNWDLALETSFAVRGSIDLLGYGPENDYANKDLFTKEESWVLVKENQSPEKTLRTGLSLDWKPGYGKILDNSATRVTKGRYWPSVNLGLSLVIVDGYGFTPEDTRDWLEASLKLGWKL